MVPEIWQHGQDGKKTKQTNENPPGKNQDAAMLETIFYHAAAMADAMCFFYCAFTAEWKRRALWQKGKVLRTTTRQKKTSAPPSAIAPHIPGLGVRKQSRVLCRNPA